MTLALVIIACLIGILCVVLAVLETAQRELARLEKRNKELLSQINQARLALEDYEDMSD